MYSCYLSLALTEYLGALLKFSQACLRLTDGSFFLLLNEELCSLLLLSQDFHQGGELDADPGGSLLESHLLMENTESCACFQEFGHIIHTMKPLAYFHTGKGLKWVFTLA